MTGSRWVVEVWTDIAITPSWFGAHLAANPRVSRPGPQRRLAAEPAPARATFVVERACRSAGPRLPTGRPEEAGSGGKGRQHPGRRRDRFERRELCFHQLCSHGTPREVRPRCPRRLRVVAGPSGHARTDA